MSAYRIWSNLWVVKAIWQEEEATAVRYCKCSERPWTACFRMENCVLWFSPELKSWVLAIRFFFLKHPSETPRSDIKLSLKGQFASQKTAKDDKRLLERSTFSFPGPLRLWRIPSWTESFSLSFVTGVLWQKSQLQGSDKFGSVTDPHTVVKNRKRRKDI